MLTAIVCQQAEGREKSYKLADANSLYLYVTPSGGKFWRMDYRFNGKRKTYGVGRYPEISLKRAREKAFAARQMIEDGVDPGAEKASRKRQEKAAYESSFEKVAREWHSKRSGDWSTRRSVRILRLLERDIFPDIGNEVIGEITAPQLIRALRKFEERDALDALADARGYLGNIFRYAIAIGKAERDVAADIRDAFKKHRPKHLAFLPKDQLPEFFEKLDNTSRKWRGKYGLLLILLTLTRTSELRKAMWHEIDFANRVWSIPAERMKMRRDHLVPLSSQCIDLLEEMRKDYSDGEYLFPSESGKHPYMSENTMTKAMWDMGYKGKATVHGFRTTGSTALHESGLFRSLVIERQLSHVDKNSVRASYNRAEYLDERRDMMQWWADRLTGFGLPI